MTPPSGGGVTPPPVRGLRILLAEDERDVASAIARMLSLDGHRVDHAADGLEALARLAHATYDVLLCDIGMPRLDGIALYRELAATRPAVARRVGFVTANVDAAGVRAFLEETGVPAAAKPLTLEGARRLVTDVLARP